MAVEILQHLETHDYYAVQYQPNLEERMSTISRICGPLTIHEAVDLFDDGDFAEDPHEDVGWAHMQPWAVVPPSRLDRER